MSLSLRDRKEDKAGRLFIPIKLSLRGKLNFHRRTHCEILLIALMISRSNSHHHFSTSSNPFSTFTAPTTKHNLRTNSSTIISFRGMCSSQNLKKTVQHSPDLQFHFYSCSSTNESFLFTQCAYFWKSKSWAKCTQVEVKTIKASHKQSINIFAEIMQVQNEFTTTCMLLQSHLLIRTQIKYLSSSSSRFKNVINHYALWCTNHGS